VAFAEAGRHRDGFARSLAREAERAGFRVSEQPQLQSYLLSRDRERKLVPFPDASPRHATVRRFFSVLGDADEWTLVAAATILPDLPETLPPALLGDDHFDRGSIEATP